MSRSTTRDCRVPEYSLEPGRDVSIVFTGIRRGERLHEILFAREEPTMDIGIAGIVAAVPMCPSL